MKFSIVIPVYNVEKYLDRCMESLLSQNFKDYEIILVDDGSTDSCPQRCDSYAAQYEKVRVIHQINGGLSDARNTGIKNALGDYICFVDSDDYWSTPDALAMISSVIDRNNPDIVRIEKKKFLVNENRFIEDGPVDFSQFENLPPDETLMSLICADTLKEAAWLLIPSREFLLKHELFFKKGIKSEDIEWSIRLYSHEPVWRFVSERIYVYLVGREGSITNTRSYNHLLDCCNSLQSSVETINNCSEKAKSALTAFILYNLSITAAHIHSSGLTKTQMKTLNGMLKPICDEYIKDHAFGRKLRLSYSVYKIGGYSLMARVLGLYLKLRGR